MSIVDKIKQYFVREKIIPQQIEKNKTRIKLFEDEQFIIYTEFLHFKKYLQHRIVKFNDSQDKQLMNDVELEVSKSNDSIDAVMINDEFNADCSNEMLEYLKQFPKSLQFMQWDLLEKNKCQVYNKSNNLYAKKVIVKKYESEGFRQLSGVQGRIFIGDGVEIYRSVDRQS